MRMPASIQERLDRWKAEDRFRTLPSSTQQGIDFYSNDYLGFALPHANLSIENLLPSGATGSRLLSGNHPLYASIEQLLFEQYQQHALLCNSGYMANLALWSCLPTRHDTILYDQYAHASIKDGIRLSLAKAYPFKHNDFNHLEELIQKSKGDVFIAIESVYSMDGDSPDASALKQIIQRYGCYCIVDEAHAFGILGSRGKGWTYQHQLEKEVLAILLPFGKAAGSMGAAIIAEKMLLNLLINNARPFIYTTALPPLLLHALYHNLLLIFEAEKPRAQLLNLSQSFHNQWIIPHIIPGNSACKKVAKVLNELGFLVRPILSPTVPEGTERLRIVLHAFNTTEQITELKKHLQISNI